MADAFGLATSMSGGLLAFLADGGWSKWLHTGWAAHGGLVAAELASRAFRGPRHALDHRYGLYGAFLGTPDTDLGVITADLGKTWLGATARAKHFPCAHVIEPYIDGALAWRSEGRVRADAVQSIRCMVAPWALPIVAEPRAVKVAPTNDLEAIASLPFMVAAALCDGRIDLATLQPQTLGRADIRALAARVTCEGDATLGSGFDGHIEATTGGISISRDVALGPPSEARMVAKFLANTARLQQTACADLEAALLRNKPATTTLVQLAAAAMTSGKSARPKGQ
jgi:2-methylcitrate dehydratase PrpD